MKYLPIPFGILMLVAALFSAPQDGGKSGKKGAKKVEVAHPFYWAAPDPLRGDWQGEGYVAQVVRADDKLLSVNDQLPDAADAGRYEAHIFRKFDGPNDKPLAILQGEQSDGRDTVNGDSWTGAIEGGHFKAKKETESFDLQHTTRTPPTL